MKTKKTITIAILLVKLSEAYDKGKYEIVHNICAELIKRGSLDLRYMDIIGRAHEKGHGVEANPVLAYPWYSLTAKRSIAGREGLKRVKAKMDKEQIAEAQKDAKNILRELLRIKGMRS